MRERRLCVVYLGHTAVLSGGELALLRLLPALRGSVDPVVILAEAGPLVDRLRGLGINVEVLQASERVRTFDRRSNGALAPVLSTLRYAWRVRRRLREIQPDLVHTNSLKAALYGGLAGRFARVPVVWHIRDRIARDYMGSSMVSLVGAAARILPTTIVVNSRTTATTVSRLRRGSFIVPSPVQVAELKQVGDPPPEPPLQVGIIGRLSPWKGQDIFLEAFAQAFSEGTGRAVIVGSAQFDAGDEDRRLRALAERLGIAEQVDLLGFREDIGVVLRDLHVLVHASTLAEPFGQVVVQGMAAGRPVVASDAGGPSEIIDDGVTGLLFPPGDVEALAHQLRRLAVDPALRQRLGQAAAQVVDEFTPEAVASEILRVYRRVVP